MSKIFNKIRQPAFFIAHGGGPMPFLQQQKKDKSYDQQAIIEHCEWLGKIIEEYKPKSILIVSAHWEEKNPTLLKNPEPPLYFDYYGFPPESYKLKYPAKCDSNGVEYTKELLKKAGFNVDYDEERGWDHGVFIPLLLARQNADIPLIQLSLCSSLNPETHIKLGQSLSTLRDNEIMIIGSGLSFHNMEAFFSYRDKINPSSVEWNTWLVNTLTDHEANIIEKCEKLKNWSKAPSAKKCHPREEHLLPLHVCLGSCVQTNNNNNNNEQDQDNNNKGNNKIECKEGVIMGNKICSIAFY